MGAFNQIRLEREIQELVALRHKILIELDDIEESLKPMLAEAYSEEGMTMRRLSTISGLSKSTLQRWMK